MSAQSAIIKFGYIDHTVFFDEKGNNRKHCAKCRFCGSKQTEVVGTSSAFTRHLRRKHMPKYEEYLQTRPPAKSKGLVVALAANLLKAKNQPKSKKKVSRGLKNHCSFLSPRVGSSSSSSSGQITQETKQMIGQSDLEMIHDDPHQKALNDSIVKDLIVGCGVPVTTMDNPHFVHFMQTVDPTWTPISCSSITEERLPQLYNQGKDRIRALLQNHPHISLTADIWSDRVMHSYLAVTAHIISPSCPPSQKPKLQSMLLGCHGFKGAYTGVQICQAFETLMDEYSIRGKITYIVADNASDMKSALKVNFPEVPTGSFDENGVVASEGVGEDEAEGTDLDDETLWEDLEENEGSFVAATLASFSEHGLSCFTHALQLVVAEGLKETQVLSHAIAKARKLASAIHSNPALKDRFESKIDANASIPMVNPKQWTSIFHLLKALLGYNFKTLTEEVFGADSTISITVDEWCQLCELVQVLEPFAEATDMFQGQAAMISLVVPTVLDLRSHLCKIQERIPYYQNVVAALQEALEQRFRGIFVLTGMVPLTEEGNCADVPFSDQIYPIAAMLDPRFGLAWIDLDVPLNGKAPLFTHQLKANCKELLITEASEETAKGHRTIHVEDAEDQSTTSRSSRLQNKYCQFRNQNSNHRRPQASPRAEVAQYFDDIQKLGSVVLESGPLQFWVDNRLRSPSLYLVALKVFGVPACGPPVEQVFSRGGVLLGPHRAQRSPSLLSMIMFLKCNQHIMTG